MGTYIKSVKPMIYVMSMIFILQSNILRNNGFQKDVVFVYSGIISFFFSTAV